MLLIASFSQNFAPSDPVHTASGPGLLMPVECFMQAHDCALTSGYFMSTLAIARPFRGVYTKMKRCCVVGSRAVRQLKVGGEHALNDNKARERWERR